MKTVTTAAVVVMTFLVGCSGQPQLDNDPSIFGLTPELRRELRVFLAETQPDKDAEKIVRELMDGLRRAADDMEMEPNEAGDYVLPDDLTEAIGTADNDDVMEIIEEFEVPLPDWAQPLVDELKAGTISEQRKELLRAVVYGTLISKLS